MCVTRRSKMLQPLFVIGIVGIQKEKKKLQIGPKHMKSLSVGHLYFTQVLCC